MKQDLYIIKIPKTCLVSRGCWGYRLQNKTENRSCVLGKDEVGGSSPPSSSNPLKLKVSRGFYLYNDIIILSNESELAFFMRQLRLAHFLKIKILHSERYRK